VNIKGSLQGLPGTFAAGRGCEYLEVRKARAKATSAPDEL
jgi:hypothetical protein